MARIREASGTAVKTGPGRVKLTLITPGKGSSGTYSPELLEQAAKDKVFPRGTMSMVNHTTAMEDMERPEGDLRNLAGVLLEDAKWEGGALVAEARIGSAWRPFVEEFGEFIGVSISAVAEVDDSGNIARLVPDPFNRADLVTVAGRGGQIAEVLEAARVIESRSMVKETTSNDIEMWLDAALRDRFTGDRQYGEPYDYPFSSDLDDQFVYYRRDGRYYRLAYTLTDSTVTLQGDPEEVRRRTEYDPITADSPAGPAGVNEKKEGATMATIDDKELADLRERSSRFDQLETELATERAERKAEQDAAREAAVESRQERAVGVIKEAFGEDAPGYQINAARLAASADDFDHDKFAAEVKEAAAASASANGAGQPSGVGETASITEAVKTDRTDDILNLRV